MFDLLALISGMGLMLGLVWIVISIRALLRGRKLIHGMLGSLSGSTVLLAGVLGLSFTLNFYTYSRLTTEQPIAQVAISQIAPKQFWLSLAENNLPVQRYQVLGDAWQLDVRILKWQPEGLLAGLDNLYRLERLSGRYDSVYAEQTEPRTIIELSEQPGVDLWILAQRFNDWLPWVDTVYGSGTFMPLTDGARFSITIGNTGLVARPNNPIAHEAIKHWN